MLLVGFGSSAGPIAAARKTLEESGLACGHAHVRVLAPFPAEELAALMKRARMTLVVENNATGQLAKLIKLHVGDVVRAEAAALAASLSATRWSDGEPAQVRRPAVPAREIVSKVQEVVFHATQAG